LLKPNILIMRTFEEYEILALKSRKKLYDIQVELEKFERETTQFRILVSQQNFFIWKIEQERLITTEKYLYEDYLQCWNVGNFSKCESIIPHLKF
jgi:hypothetical protein